LKLSSVINRTIFQLLMVSWSCHRETTRLALEHLTRRS
jgi:hypothetical protein